MKRGDRTTICVLGIVTFAILGALDWHSRATASRQEAASGTVATVDVVSKPDSKPKKPLLSKFMRAKLAASGEVLEGLCTHDYDLIAKGAKRLHTMSRAEKWRVSNDAMYRQHSVEFRSGVDRLLEAARKKQLDAAALAWTKTTLNCIECHRWVKAMLISDK